MPILLGLSTFKSAFEVWADKLGLGEETPESEAMLWGRKLEAVVADHYAELTGRELEDLGRYSCIWPGAPFPDWFFATPDRMIHGDPRGLGVLEVKTTRFGSEWEEGTPERVWIQLQQEIAATGAKWGSVAVLIEGQTFRWADHDRDDACIQERIIPAGNALWELVKSRTAPDVDGSEGTRRAIDRVFSSKVEGKGIELPGDLRELDEKLLDLDELVKEGKREVEAIKNRIRLILGEASAVEGYLPGGIVYRLVERQRKAYEVAASSYVELVRKAPKLRA
jgi:predicted phage-related endonuclease